MLTVNRYKETLKEEFYLDADDITIRRKVDGWRMKYLKDDVVKPYKLTGNADYTYGGIHIPRTRTTVSVHHLITLLRGTIIPDGSVIDHLDGDTTNNSRKNIRVTSQKYNARNSKKSKNNTSGYNGINWNKSAKCYAIRKYLNGKRVARSSKTLEGAIVILREMELEGLSEGYTDRHGK